jgi:predicted MFS family arabinose efflux permease
MQLVWTIPVFFKSSLGFNEAEVGLLMALNGLIVAVVEMPLIFKIENLRPIKHWIRLGLFLYSISFFALNLPIAGLIAALVCIVGLSIGEILVMPFSSNYVSNKAGTDKIGQYMALYSIAYAVANILAPLIGTQIIARFGYAALWSGLGVLAFVDYLGFRWLK